MVIVKKKILKKCRDWHFVQDLIVSFEDVFISYKNSFLGRKENNKKKRKKKKITEKKKTKKKIITVYVSMPKGLDNIHFGWDRGSESILDPQCTIDLMRVVYK